MSDERSTSDEQMSEEQMSDEQMSEAPPSLYIPNLPSHEPLKIWEWPHPVLCKPSAPIERFDEALLTLTEQMWVTMYHARGVGLAAPQVGVSTRLLVMDCAFSQEAPRRFVCVNPTLHDLGELIDSSEGCLSFPGLSVEVPRHATLTLKAFDEYGAPFELALEGLEAICAQHETDHLNGESFLDRLGFMERKAALLDYTVALDQQLSELKAEPKADRELISSLEEALELARGLLMGS